MKDERETIKENRFIWDDQEPDKGHFERFEKRLNRKAKLTGVFAVAASVAVLICLGMWLFLSPDKAGENELSEQSMTNEIGEVDRFYKEQMKVEISAIQCKMEKTDHQIRNQLEEDLQNIILENNRFVEKIQKDEDAELAIFYLVKHYKTNLKILQFINDKLGNYVEC
jgi:hypothetical protein